jgi:hypothetical protein
LLDHQVAGTADQDQMLDIVAAHEYQPPAIIDSCGVSNRETDLPVAPAGNECSTRHPPQYGEYQ